MAHSARTTPAQAQAELAELHALVARLDRENVGLRRALAEASSGDVEAASSAGESGLPVAEERNLFVRGPVVVFKWRNAAGWPVEYVSPNVAGVFGHSAEAFLSGAVPYAELIHPDDLERVGREVSEASASSRSSFEHAPYRITTRDGRVRWLFDFTTILRDAEGEASHYLGYVIDISDHIEAEQERQALEARMLQAQKLESLGVLAGGIAHDFNNLLTAILGNTELAQDAGPQALQRHLGAITVATRRAAGLCNQMLAYAGRGRFEIGPVDLNDLVGEMGELLGVTLPKGVRLQRDLAPDLPPVRADADQLRQVVMNLITNAAESIDGGEGQVQLTTSRGDRRLPGSEIVAPGPGAADEPPPVRLEVRDTGCGMDAETLARIFDPFFSTKFKGRGLGLAAVQGIVRRLGGGLAVESAPGEGSRFTLLLPVSADDAARSRQRPGTAPRRRRGTALVAEDEPDVRQVIEGLLRQLGLEVLSAGDGRQALELAAGGGALDLAVLDMTMPHLGGAETLPRLRALRPDLPVLLVSGYAAGDVLQRLGRPDGVRFVTKPFTARRFHEAVDALLPAD